jgi:carbon-monoxide dehydrogenase large subunit
MRLGSWVIAKAADAIVEKGRRLAGAMLEAAEEDIEFAQQRFRIKGTDSGVGLFEVAAAALGESVPSDLRGPLMGISEETMSIPSYAYTCAVCEVEVDPETGLVEVVRYASIDDCGRAVNPMLIHGQSHGGIAQGIGQALWEACVYDPRSGQLLSGSFLDYAMPRADVLPAFDTEISEVPSTTNPLGMRGGSEGGITPGSPRWRTRSSTRSRSSTSSTLSCRPHPRTSGTQSAPHACDELGALLTIAIA